MLQLELSRKVRPRKDSKQAILGEVNLREYLYVVEELRMRRNEYATKKQYSELTKWMIGSKPGDCVSWRPITLSEITGSRATARKALDNKNAKWSSRTLKNGYVEIERLKDTDEYVYGVPRSPIPAMLAGMNVHGRTKIKYDKGGKRRRFPHKFKVIARKILNQPDANWKYQMLASGHIAVMRTR